MQKAVVVLLLALFCLSLCAQQNVAAIAVQSKAAARALPADAPTREQVLTLFDLLQVRKTMVVMMDGMKKAAQDSAEQTLRQRVPDPTPRQMELLNKMMADLFSNMPLDEMVDAIIPVYQSHLTKSDLEEIIRFYSSPVGQKLLREQPQMIQESMKAGTDIQQRHMDTLLQKMDERMQEIIEAGEDKKPAPKK